jgi:3,4-dihydroxy 2-butanone 4-phosphate synthase/GTP cyclohydrolase II
MRYIADKGRGVVLYLCLDPDGARMARELAACGRHLDEKEYSYAEEIFMREDQKDYGIGAQILSTLGLRRIIVLTCHTRKFSVLQSYGLEVVEQRDIDTP